MKHYRSVVLSFHGANGFESLQIWGIEPTMELLRFFLSTMHPAYKVGEDTEK